MKPIDPDDSHAVPLLHSFAREQARAAQMQVRTRAHAHADVLCCGVPKRARACVCV
jgi:hypothetical protein